MTLKEALPTVGGMMAYGIPSYRLPREIIAEEANVIEEQGVKIEVNTKVEKPAELLKEYDAVLMTIGGHKGVRLPMEGSELDGVILISCAMQAWEKKPESENGSSFSVEETLHLTVQEPQNVLAQKKFIWLVWKQEM